MSKKKIILYSVSLLVVIALITTVIMLTREKPTNAHNPEFAEYITAYPSGMLSKQDPVSLQLTSTTLKAYKDKEVETDELFSFEPDIEGKTELKGNMLQFIPDEALPSGKKFYVEFNLGNILKVKNNLKKFTFSFFVKEQDMEFEITEHQTIDLKELKYQQIKGIVRTADTEKTEKIAETLIARQDGDELKVEWKSDADGTNHYFTIDSIKRKKEEDRIEIKINGRDIGASFKTKETVSIPGYSNFELISTKVYNDPEQVLHLQFSDPLMPNQDLNGLVRIKGIKNIKYLIDNNTILVYPPEQLNDVMLVEINESVKNVLGFPIGEKLKFSVAFEELEPEINFLGSGNILPSTDKGMLVPFEAVNLKAVDVAVIKIHENNVLQFLQHNDMGNDYNLRYVGKPIAMQTIRLDEFKIRDMGVKNRFHLDLNKLIEAEPGAIYRVIFKAKKEYSLYSCAAEENGDKEITGIETDESLTWESFNDYFGYHYYYWRDRDDPCKEAFYNDLKTGKNILSSNLGIISKKGKDHSLNIFVTDLLSAQPKESISVEIYDFQQQLLAEALTDNEGKAVFENMPEAYFVVAKHGNEKGYLRLYEGEALNLSKFNVSGKTVTKGVKGYIYEERGVRRPGDSIYITFVLHEQDGKLPENLPLNFRLTDPLGKLVKTETQTLNNTGFYTFKALTDYNAPTGNYMFTAEAGVLNFNKIIKVETIKPNRLDIKLNFNEKQISEAKGINAELAAKWLHGMPAKDMKTKVELTLNTVTTKFPKFSGYVFDDPVKSYYAETETIHEGKTDAEGKTQVKKHLNTKENAPGMLRADFTMRVFEKGGNFSISKASMPYSPFEAYLGISTPETDNNRYYYESGDDMECEFVLCDADGKLMKDNRAVQLYFYKLSWRWWWNASRNQISSYNFKNSAELVKKEQINLSNGKAEWEVSTDKEDWGRYLVWAVDPQSGHSTGKIVYFDWPYRSDGDENKEGASMLVFSTDKEEYEVGERAEVSFPSGSDGNALVSIENGTKVIKTFWTKTRKGTTTFKFDVTPDMHPNAYIHITLLQEHMQTANDLPIRMYGVMPLNVRDESTILNPVIDMPDELESEQTVKIEVSEKNNKPMTYTLAVVDEGLLGITNFKTPNPADEFFAKEALGVKTWDLFNLVIGAQKGKAERLLSIGGDMEIDRDQKEKAKRFKPVVTFLGPFTLQSGSRTHYVKIPKYIGAVRTMIVAGDKDKAYGSAEKTTPVTKPLMVVSTLPRVLRPQEKIKMPVTVFAMKDNIKNAKITVKTDKHLKIIGEATQNINFTKPGEQTIDFELEVQQLTGVTKVEVIATSGNEKSSEIVELDVENPNAFTNVTDNKFLESGQKWENSFELIGIQGTNNAFIEVSTLPSINLESRLRYLIRYPHGCIEQTTSSAFPQLYLSSITDLDTEQKKTVEKNIKATIKRFNKFQLPNGGFSYWAGGRDASLWGTNYAGHFLAEAEKAGYPVSPEMMKKWRDFQKTQARNWTDLGPSSQLMQAYRLYTLALAGHPERSAMNRLNSDKLSVAAKWRLAAAYQISGKNRTARKMIDDLPLKVPEYRELYYTYGSDMRDEAMILETLVLSDDKAKAFRVLQSLAKRLSSNNYYSTQTTAYALIAVSGYINKYAKGKETVFSYSINGKTATISEKTPLTKINLNLSELKTHRLVVENKGQTPLYVSLLREGKPPIGKAVNNSNDLMLSIRFELPDGTSIQPSSIKQGTDFVAYVRVKNPGLRGHYHEMALSQIFPSGWEIINTRLFEIDAVEPQPAVKYQDIRDDRVYTYFDLGRNQSKTFKIMLNASYAGEFWMPPVQCEAMYDHTISASEGGQFVYVIRE